MIENPVKLRQWNTPVPISDIIYPSSSKAIESPVKLRKYNTSVPISDINDLPVAIEVARISPQVAQFSPLVPDQPEITSRMPLSLDELFVAQHNFKERPPPILPEIRHNNKSNRYFKKNERRISHYHDKQQPHSSTDANKTPESYRDYKLRKETERIANNRKLQHTTVSSGSIQRRNDEPSTSSDFSMDLGEISSKFLENFAPTNNQSQISEPAEKPLPQLINCDNNYFSQFMPLIDEDILNPIQIKQEKVSEQSEEERCRGELTDENSNCETKVLIKQEPEEIFSNIDENTADFTELFNQQCVKEEPLDL